MEAAMSDEPENFTLALLRKIDGKVDNLASEVADMRKAMATKSDVADVRSELRSEIHSLRADVASDMMNLEKQIKEQEKRLSDQISGLRRSVMEYHSSQIGHGVLLTEFEERLRRLEEHVGLPPEGH
ncbi:hypothetical protein D1O30_00495 [Methylocystis hirsuta]|uniref:Uncharacterized protein n=2 Tax=Methylocystis hirsuta TaxID=369798 RepID=A0A3M9XKL2_9HYPH|nr:hypothetical protein D1O30_00495 [Methylocystis hirsuta]